MEGYHLVRRIYAALLRFDGVEEAALVPARAHVRYWVSRPWGGWPESHGAVKGTFTADGDSIVSWRTLEGNSARLWELNVDESFCDVPSMRQSTQIQVGETGGEAFTFVQVSVRSTDGALAGDFHYEYKPPEVVPLLVNKVPCSDGGRVLFSRAWPINRSQEHEFVQLLEAPNRQLPAVLFVADALITQSQADEVAVALAGLAHVAFVCREDLDGFLERSGLEVPLGTNAYIWWAKGSDTRPRLYWFRSDAMSPSRWGTPAWQVVHTVYNAASFRFDPPALASQLETESAQRRIHAIEANVESSSAYSELLQTWERDLVDLDRARRHETYLEMENERLQQDFNALLGAFEEAVVEASAASIEHDTPPDEAPTTLVDAIGAAEKRSSALVFLPEAYRSAQAWRYQRPDIVFTALVTLDDLVLCWRRGELEGSFLIAARAAGLPWRPSLSRTAEGHFREDYLRIYRGQEILLGPHLAWGNSPHNALRIYLYLDRETRTIVVGHAGRHLRDASNPHL